jgi:CxC2 like cysteine cluster associated with KDZ transposases
MEGQTSPTCQFCGDTKQIFRCQDCWGCPIYCEPCIIAHHRLLPFHRIERWTGKFFIRSELSSHGQILHVGHWGDPCPSIVGNVNQTTSISVVHTSGIYRCNIVYCHCPDAPPHHIQLVHMRLFPSSFDRPQTVFTFSLLDYFNLDTLECKTSANNFFNKLKRLTNNAFPHLVQVNYCCLVSLYA